jgi:secreted trypsin-like serine protease
MLQSKHVSQRSRAVVLLAVLTSCVFALLLVREDDGRAATREDGIRPSLGVNSQLDIRPTPMIIEGFGTSISSWPWQVALAYRPGFGASGSPRARKVCGGTVIGPRLVLTAAHCVVGGPSWAAPSVKSPQRFEVIAGRTVLNSAGGQVVRVNRIELPRRYYSNRIRLDWDVALLQLENSLSVSPIQIAGPSEFRASRPGQVLFATGWGQRTWRDYGGSPNLRVARLMMFKSSACRLTYGSYFQSSINICFGGPGEKATICSGDSGGPIVSPVKGGFRLVGLSGFGSDYCWGHLPVGGPRVSADPIRTWIAETALGLTGDQVVGRGALVSRAPDSCRVPNLYGMRFLRARAIARRNGCGVSSIFQLTPKARRIGRIDSQGPEPGWFGVKGLKIGVGVRLGRG